MQFSLENNIDIELTFDTEPTTPTFLDLFEYVENIQTALPTCLIRLNCRDNDLTFVKESLYDGAKLKATVKHLLIDFAYNLNLCIFGTPSITPSTLTNEGYDITINAILNHPRYLSGLANTAYSGSVSSVLKQIATACNLKTEVIPTNDNQTWFGHGRSYSALVKYLADHCFLSNVALPVTGITHPNLLLLRDVTSILKQEPTHLLGYQTKVLYTQDASGKNNTTPFPNSYTFQTYRSKNISGLYNATSAYGSSFVQNSIQQDRAFENSTVTFSRKLSNSEINKKTKTLLKEVAINYLPLDTGNTYPNFYKAEAKNRRLRNLYSNILTVLCINEYTKIKLLDCVQVSIDLKFEDAKEDVYSGNYLVTAKTVNITRNVFREMITLTNHGRNTKNKQLL